MMENIKTKISNRWYVNRENGFWVSDGIKCFDATNESDAIWLRDLLNTNPVSVKMGERDAETMWEQMENYLTELELNYES